MILGRIEIQNVRNLRSISLELAPSVNIFHGDNGSGKTSLLEGVALLGLGRSFRSTRIHSVINHDEERCEVFGRVETEGGRTVRIGISRSRDGSREMRVDGEPVTQVAEISRVLPLQVLNTESIGLLAGPPELRRRFLNWGVFHVEPEFHPVWRTYQHCTRQRNALLRDGKMDRAELQVWTRQLARAGEQIDRYRKAYVDRLEPLFRQVLGNIFPAENIELAYQRGWDRAAGLEELLDRETDQDMARGFTRAGPHRAELAVRSDGRPVAEILSRGELKVVSCGLMTAQVTLLNGEADRRCIFLIDDLASELDRDYRGRLCGLIEERGNQVLVTSVGRESLAECWTKCEPRLFHVEQGRIDPECDE